MQELRSREVGKSLQKFIFSSFQTLSQPVSNLFWGRTGHFQMKTFSARQKNYFLP